MRELFVYLIANAPRVRDGYIRSGTRGHARALKAQREGTICRENVVASTRPCPRRGSVEPHSQVAQPNRLNKRPTKPRRAARRTACSLGTGFGDVCLLPRSLVFTPKPTTRALFRGRACRRIVRSPARHATVSRCAGRASPSIELRRPRLTCDQAPIIRVIAFERVGRDVAAMLVGGGALHQRRSGRR